MKFIKAETPKSKKVLLMNDIHFGSESLDYDFLKRVKKFIEKEQPSIIINGDVIQGITKLSKGSLYEQKKTPKEQVDEAVDFFEPYKDLIACVIKGNHDDRITEETSFDPMEIFTNYLGIEERFGGYRAIVGYSLKNFFYSIEVYHGSGGAGTTASIEQAMRRFRQSDADVFYCGHFHSEVSLAPYIQHVIDPYNKKIHEHLRYNICGSSCVHQESYGDKKAMRKKLPSQAYLTLSDEKGKRNIEVSWLRWLVKDI